MYVAFKPFLLVVFNFMQMKKYSCYFIRLKFHYYQRGTAPKNDQTTESTTILTKTEPSWWQNSFRYEA